MGVKEHVSHRALVLRLLHGDCIKELRGLDADSVAAVVTDPPYG